MNIFNAFKKSGIWPCNKDIFQESDFAPSFGTDRLDPSDPNQSLVSKPPVEDEINADNLSLNLENAEVLNDIPNLNISVTEVISQISNEPVLRPSGVQKDVSDFMVETIRPLPKALPRASSHRKRIKKSAILTDTPEKNALEEEYNIRELKKNKMSAKDQNIKNKGEGKGKGKGKSRGNGKLKKGEKIEKVKKKILNESNDDEDEYFCIVCSVTYNEGISDGEWIQCIFCKEWSQAGCIKGDLTSFTCLNCNSDDEYE